MAELNKDWRKLLDALLLAHSEDVGRGVERGLSGSEDLLLEEYGTPSFRSGREKVAKAEHDWLSRREISATYEVIEESANRVIVQVRPPAYSRDRLRVPRITTRIHFVAANTGWQVERILQPCLSCSFLHTHGAAPPPQELPPLSTRISGKLSAAPKFIRKSTPGKCMFCDGTGVPFGIRDWRQGPETCEYCGGTGECQGCAREEVPGWWRVYSLGGMLEGEDGDTA